MHLHLSSAESLCPLPGKEGAYFILGMQTVESMEFLRLWAKGVPEKGG
jgi:hypothetical protein